MTGRSVAIVVLGAGRASRMGESGAHKLLAEFDGIPLIRRVVVAACASAASSVTVVVGHRQAEVAATLDGLPVSIIQNAAYATGMASSLKAGFVADRPAVADGVLVMMGDMPGISSANIDHLIDVFQHASSLSIVRAAAHCQPGNPVLLPRLLETAILRLEGDTGARRIIETCGLPIIDAEIGDVARLDLDTPEAIISAGGILKG